MAWRNPPILNWTSKQAQAATSTALYFTRCYLHLAAGQVVVTIWTTYESISVFLLSNIIFQLFAVSVLLPTFFLQVLFDLVPTVLGNIWCLFFPWDRLIEQTESNRRQLAMLAQLQLEGKYIFRDDDVIRVARSGKEWMDDISWHEQTEELSVCGARARFVHLRPEGGDNSSNSPLSKRPIVFLHGSRSWSYMWRKIMPRLLEEGHEVYALDWIGHGRSDKPTRRDSVTFELHMQTLIAFVNHVQLKGAVLVAHSWGGYVALCSIPHLPSSSCSGLFFVNSFIPCQPNKLSPDGRVLYGLWFLLTQVLDGYVSQSIITRLMFHEVPRRDAKGYAAPYQHLPANAGPSVDPFAHMSTGIPLHILRNLREKPLWKVCEAFCPKSFSGLNALALLSERVDSASRYLRENQSGDQNKGTESRLKSVIVFGGRDPLGRGYKEALLHVIGKNNMADWAPDGILLENAGHYPMEDKPEDVAQLITRFAKIYSGSSSVGGGEVKS